MSAAVIVGCKPNGIGAKKRPPVLGIISEKRKVRSELNEKKISIL